MTGAGLCQQYLGVEMGGLGLCLRFLSAWGPGRKAKQSPSSAQVQDGQGRGSYMTLASHMHIA